VDIIFKGSHHSDEAMKSLIGVIKLFCDRYHIHQFREMHLSVTLVDESGSDVELYDSETNEAYRIFEIYRPTQKTERRRVRPNLKLVIDNKNQK
jgi:hypothetical protein